MTKLTVRTLFAATLFIAMLCATNAQAQSIQLGSWDSDDDGGRGRSIISRIFEGGDWSPPGRDNGRDNGNAFGRINPGGINLGSIVSRAQELINAHRNGGIIRIDIPDIRPHFGGGLTPVPEPTAALLFAIGVGVVATRRKI